MIEARHAAGWLLVAVVVLAVPGLAAAGGGDACDGVLTNRSGDAGPGGTLAGAIGEQASAIESELADRRFDARLRNASSDAERAAVVAAELDRLRSHVDALAACASLLENHSAAGRIDDATFHNRTGALAAHANATARRVNETAAAAARLPDAVRREYGVDERAVSALRSRAVALRRSLNATAAGETPAGGVSGGAGESDAGGTGDDGAATGPFR